MKFIEYLKDKMWSIFIYCIMLIIIYIILWIFSVRKIISINIFIILVCTGLIIILYNYLRKKEFYDKMNYLINNLTEKYFVTEIIKKPKFLEGKLLYEYLYNINKVMIEQINNYKSINENFKDYIEAWCHEIKTPVSVSKMILINNKNEVTDSLDEELNKISNYIDQVLYYARSENVEKDYIIKNVNLKDVVSNVIKNNKKNLILKKIKINMNNLDVEVKSDIKWLEFIINQIVSNSIKYSKDENAYINFYTKKLKNGVEFIIEDNGIGILSSEVDRVFQKGFTGKNGRKKYNSTGIGLYLCKKLCDKLEHNIQLESKEDEWTKVKIIFPINYSLKEIL